MFHVSDLGKHLFELDSAGWVLVRPLLTVGIGTAHSLRQADGEIQHVQVPRAQPVCIWIALQRRGRRRGRVAPWRPARHARNMVIRFVCSHCESAHAPIKHTHQRTAPKGIANLLRVLGISPPSRPILRHPAVVAGKLRGPPLLERSEPARRKLLYVMRPEGSVLPTRCRVLRTLLHLQ